MLTPLTRADSGAEVPPLTNNGNITNNSPYFAALPEGLSMLIRQASEIART
jgi:hypothetical protein